MADNDMNNKTTDAHASIAGYHKQIYVAVELLTTLEEDEDSVGVECGADVACFYKNGSFTTREVKFYKRAFSKFDPEICKTIYNFYKNSFNSVQLTFDTNSRMRSIDFSSIMSDESGKSTYIKECLLKHCIDNVEPYKENFEKYIKENQFSRDEAIELLIKGNDPRYSIILSSKSIDDFSKKISFQFENLSQIESFSNSVERIIKSLKKFVINNMELDIEDKIYNAITHRIADEFYETCIKNNDINKKDIDYNSYDKISIKNLKEIISDYSSYVDKYREDVVMKKIIDFLEVIDVPKLINQYKNECSILNDYIKIKSVLNFDSLRVYLNSIGKKFLDENDWELFKSRFQLYTEGLGFVGLLIKLDITMLDVSETNLVLEYKKNRYSIYNEDLYNIDDIIFYIRQNKQQDNGHLEFALFNDLSLTIFNMFTRKFVQIEKACPRGESLKELVDETELEEVEKIIHRILSDKLNCLVIGDVITKRKALFNAVIRQVPNSKKVISFIENQSYKLSPERQVDDVLIPEIDHHEKVEHIKEYNRIIDRNDYKFFDLENYHNISNSVLDTILGLHKAKEGFYTAFKYSTNSISQDVDGYLEMIKVIYKAHGKNVDFQLIDCLIILKSCLIKAKETTVIDKIFIKDSSGKWEKLFKHVYDYEKRV